MENQLIDELLEMEDDDFFVEMSTFISENGLSERDFKLKYPDLYDRYIDIFDRSDEEDDDDLEVPSFRDLYMKDTSTSYSPPSFSNMEEFLAPISLGGIFSGNTSPITSAFHAMRNGGYIGRYVNGGNVSPAYSNYMAVGNSKKIEGIVPTNNMIPIQTEVGELIVHPTMDITSVNANKRHSRLDPNEVTDIVPEGSYVLSRHGVVKIYKDEADKVVIETENKPYNLYTNNPQPKVKTLGSLMTKKEMAPAELASSILNKYKIVNNDDPFTEQTNKANKYNSSKFIKSIIELSEFDKARKGLSNGENMSNMFNQEPDQWSQNGGYSRGTHYQDWGKVASGAIKLLPSLTSLAGSLFGSRSARSANQQARSLSQDYAKQYGDILGTANKLGFMSNLASTLGQDPTVQVAKRDSSYLQGLMNRLGSIAERNAFMQDLAASSPDLSKVDPRAAGALGAQLWANQLRSVSDFNTRQAASDRAAREKYTGAMAENAFFNQQQDVQKANQELNNRNRLLATLGSQASGYAGSQGEIALNQMAAKIGAERDYLTNEAKRKTDLWSNLTRTAGILGTDENLGILKGMFSRTPPAAPAAPSAPTPPPPPLMLNTPYSPNDPRLYSPSGSWQPSQVSSWGGYKLNWP